MSLESLLQHILFTGHQAEESRRAMREVRAEITRCRGRIKKAAEDLNEEKLTLESKVQQFSEKSFLLELLKTRENALERQCSEVMNQRDTLLQAFEATKKKATEEEEKFIKEITDFNDNYELIKKRDILMNEDIKMEIADLENQANVLRGEMKSMECNSGQLQELQKLKSELLQELFTLQKKLKVLEDEETEAVCTTKYLQEEKTKVKEKPQHDAECLRLKRELDLYQEEDMESACRALQTEVECLAQIHKAMKSIVIALSKYLKKFSGPDPGFDLVHPNIYPSDELLESTKGPLPQIHNYRTSMTQGNNRFLKSKDSLLLIGWYGDCMLVITYSCALLPLVSYRGNIRESTRHVEPLL
ncbi:coiled-coil domain-containing protein 172 [Acomys russatus]|uniref:coiled-coil domain-containing protein 172 n=1 Tax=Acomys russatus TaxID=60746 RepID=UPI0021E2A08C|nr:coiled-coil domain-containing protein 172 [Acomys russatus]